MTRPAAVYRYFNAEGALLYVGCTVNPTARHREHGSKAPWAGSIAIWTVDWFETREEARTRETQAIAAEKPIFNRLGNPECSESSLEPASTIIRRLGGPTKVAARLDVHKTRAFGWMRPKAKGGTGGLVPFRHVPDLIAFAAELGQPLSADDFLPVRGAA